MLSQSWKIGLSAGVLGLLALLGAVVSYLVAGQFGPMSITMAAVGAVLLGVFVWTLPAETRSVAGGRYMRYGGNALIMLAAFAAILGLLNFLASRHYTRWDLTANKQFTLSPQTINVLKNLKDPVTVTAFYQTGDVQLETAQDLFKEYSLHTDKIKVDYVDPDTKPAIARQFQITSYGTVVFQSGDKRQDVLNASESDFTGALVKLTSPEKTVYFLTGHGERSPDGTARDGYSQVKQALQNNNYKVETLNLTTNPKLTPDMGTLVIAGPQTALLDKEKEVIQGFIDQGGKVMLMLDPRSQASLDDLVKKWNLQFGQGVVVDPAAAFFNDVATVVVSKYPFSKITNGLPMTVFPFARSIVVPQDQPQGVTFTKLAETSDRSWLETDQQVARFDQGQDTQGPLTLGLSVETTTAGTAGQGDNKNDTSQANSTRAVLFGNTEFASNGFVTAGGNQSLFVNAVNWLSESEELIAISPKPPENRTVILTSNQTNTIMFTSAALVPAIVLLAGATVWWRRR